MRAAIVQCAHASVRELTECAKAHLAELAKELDPKKWTIRIVIERKD